MNKMAYVAAILFTILKLLNFKKYRLSSGSSLGG